MKLCFKLVEQDIFSDSTFLFSELIRYKIKVNKEIVPNYFTLRLLKVQASNKEQKQSVSKGSFCCWQAANIVTFYLVNNKK